MGCQFVVLPWLAVGELKLEADQVGWVQSLSLLPGVLLLLLGGAVADRDSSRWFLPLFYLLLAAIHGAMAWLLAIEGLSLWWLLLYALMLGVFSAFIQPLRERLLPILLTPEQRIQRSVVIMSLCLYVAQAIGVAFAGQFDRFGAQTVLLGQVLCLLVAAILFFVLALTSQPQQKPKSSQSLLEVVGYVWRERVLRDLVLLVGFNGFLHIGVFVVALPLLARDGYQQGAVYFASLQLCFVLGSIAATLGLLKRGPAQYPGRSVLFCLLYTGMLMIAIAAKPTLNGLFGLVFLWGVVAGVAASLGKGLLQQQAPEAYRGRILSIYQLSLFGAAPLGALVCGYLVNSLGAWLLFQVVGYTSAAIFVVFCFSRPMWQVEN